MGDRHIIGERYSADRRKILGIGLAKTGTNSLIRALQILGLNAAHCLPREAGILDSVEAAADSPIATQFEQLDAIYPRSRFICTVRDYGSWLTSCRIHFARPHERNVENLYRLKMFGTTTFDEEKFRTAYYAHQERVNSYFAKRRDDLLILDIVGGEGWEKLCGFLQLGMPGGEFPWCNKRGERPPHVARAQDSGPRTVFFSECGGRDCNA